jgi:hypothetical protein
MDVTATNSAFEPDLEASWDVFINQIDRIDGLTAVDCEYIRRAFEYLRRAEVLGEAFPSHAKRSNHPLWAQFHRSVPWAAKELARFADALRDLSASERFFTHMLPQLRDPESFAERSSVLEVAYKLFLAGFIVAFDMPGTARRPKGLKHKRLISYTVHPDIRIIDPESNEVVFVEVSALGPGVRREEYSRTYHSLLRLLIAQGTWEQSLCSCARLLRPLPGGELDEVLNEVRELIGEVWLTGEFRELIKVDTLELCIAPSEQAEQVNQWGKDRGIRLRPVEGPVHKLYDARRAKNIIGNKRDKLPSDFPGVVVITANWTLLFEAHLLSEIISEVEDALAESPPISLSVLTHRFLDVACPDKLVEVGDHVFISKLTEAEIFEQSLISVNRQCNMGLSARMVSKLRRAFGVG